MKLRELFESKTESVGIIFGRFNPPHQGHRAAWEMAAENDRWFVGTNKSTQGPKDPLPYDIKVQAMLAVWPKIKGHIVPETSWLTLASKIYKKFGNVELNVYTDEDWVTKTIVQYNGKEGPHGFYNFPSIQQHPTPRLSSATALRAAVEAGDRKAFEKAAGVPADTDVAGYPFFDTVAKYLLPYQNTPKKTATKKDKGKGAMDLATLRSAAKNAKPVKDIAEFSYSDNGGRIPPRGPKNKGRDPWDGDDSGEDPYSRPNPKYYEHSIDFFGQFEADHFDDEVFDKKTGVFKGYWDDEEGRTQIAYFKFDNPRRTGSDDPGMGWYYEPQM